MSPFLLRGDSMAEVVQMSLKEADRYAVILQVIERTMAQSDAALWLRLRKLQAKVASQNASKQSRDTA